LERKDGDCLPHSFQPDHLYRLRRKLNEFHEDRISQQQALWAQLEMATVFLHEPALNPGGDPGITFDGRFLEPSAERIDRDSFGHPQAEKQEFANRLIFVDGFSSDGRMS
jgi:hypothetical protein